MCKPTFINTTVGKCEREISVKSSVKSINLIISDTGTHKKRF